MNMDALSWMVAAGQVTATLLIGSRPSINAQRPGLAEGAGWAVLCTTHLTLTFFGYAGDYPGFQIVQPLMIPLTGFKLWLWWAAVRQPLPALAYAGHGPITIRRGNHD